MGSESTAVGVQADVLDPAALLAEVDPLDDEVAAVEPLVADGSAAAGAADGPVADEWREGL